MEYRDNYSRSSSFSRARGDSEIQVYSKAHRQSDALDYSLAAKVYLEEQTIYLRVKTSLRNFNVMLLVSIVLLSASFLLVHYLGWMGVIQLGVIDIVVSAFLIQNLLLVGVALCVKLSESMAKIAVLFRLLQFAIFQAVSLFTASVMIGVKYSQAIDERKFYILLIIQLIETIRIVVLLKKTKRILNILKEIESMQDHFASLLSSEKSMQY